MRLFVLGLFGGPHLTARTLPNDTPVIDLLAEPSRPERCAPVGDASGMRLQLRGKVCIGIYSNCSVRMSREWESGDQIGET
jgi:hypothetical protein